MLEFACKSLAEPGDRAGCSMFSTGTGSLLWVSGCWALGFCLMEGEKKNAVFKYDLIREGCKKQLLVLAEPAGAASAASPWSSGAGGRCARLTAPGSFLLLRCRSCGTGTGTPSEEAKPPVLDKHSPAGRQGKGEALESPLTLAQRFQQQNQLLFRAQVRAECSHGQVMRP